MLGQEGRAVAKQKPSTPEKFRANRIVAWQGDQKDTLLAILSGLQSPRNAFWARNYAYFSIETDALTFVLNVQW